MPFIIMRRSDIPNGVLQVDDLKPNDSQRNYTLDPPGQSGYVRNIPANETVVTVGAGPILILRDVCGLAGYLIDNVEDSAGTAITAAVANTASAAIIVRAQAALTVQTADVDAELVAAGAGAGTGLTAGNSTGLLVELLSLLSGAVYDLPAGSEVETAANLFNATRMGSFVTTPGVKFVRQTGAFNVSNGAGDLFRYKQANFEYAGVLGPAITVYSNTGAIL